MPFASSLLYIGGGPFMDNKKEYQYTIIMYTTYYVFNIAYCQIYCIHKKYCM